MCDTIIVVEQRSPDLKRRGIKMENTITELKEKVQDLKKLVVELADDKYTKEEKNLVHSCSWAK